MGCQVGGSRPCIEQLANVWQTIRESTVNIEANTQSLAERFELPPSVVNRKFTELLIHDTNVSSRACAPRGNGHG